MNRPMHVKPAFGLPYARAGVDASGRATATCPICGHVASGRDHKAAGRAYAEHFAATAAAEDDPANYSDDGLYHGGRR